MEAGLSIDARHPRVCGALLVLVTLAVYAPVSLAGFIWDDDVHLLDDTNLESIDGLRAIWLDPQSEPQYYPLVHTSFWLEYRLWRLDPLGYHVDNVLLHGLNALLFWCLLRRLDVGGAFAAALLFAVHPVHVESVAWVTERKNVLSLFFDLAAALSYWRFDPATFRDGDSSPPSEGRPKWLYALTMLLFGCALLSKSVTGSLPAAILVVVWWKRGRIRWRDVAPLLPMFVMALVAGLHTSYLEQHHVGAIGAAWDHSLLERVLIAGRAVWFYAVKLIWPHPLAFFYPFWNVDPGVWWQSLFPLSAIALPIMLFLFRERLGRGPLAAVLLFGGTLFPALGFFNVYPMRYSFVADHFQYLASLSLLAIAGVGYMRLLRNGRVPDRIVHGAALLIAVCFSVLTWQRAVVFQNPISLWVDTLDKNPSSSAAELNLGLAIHEVGHVDAAIAHIRRSLELDPTNAEAHFSLGLIYWEQQRENAAIEQFQQTLEIEPGHPSAHTMLGGISTRHGDYTTAIQHYERALERTSFGVLSGDRQQVQELRDEITRLRGMQSSP